MTAPLASAKESLYSNARNLDALQLCACVQRLRGDSAGANAALAALLELDPLNHFARFEQYLRGKARAAEFTALIRNELPYETFLELAIWYHDVGWTPRPPKSSTLRPRPPKCSIGWRICAATPTSSPAPKQHRPSSSSRSERRQFPCSNGPRSNARPGSPTISSRSSAGTWANWPRPGGSSPGAATSPFAPFYAARAQLAETDAVRDLQRAAQLDPAQWRYGAMLARHYLKQDDPAAALAVAADYSRRFPRTTRWRCCTPNPCSCRPNQAAADFLSSMHILPAEGTTDARALFHEAFLLLAAERLQAGAFDDALRLVSTAREWPERLGAGKPYPADLDERLEDWFTAECQLGRKAPAEARHALDRILAIPARSKGQSTGDLIRALALKQSGRTAEAEQLLKAWQAQDPGTDLAKWGAESSPASPPLCLPPSRTPTAASWPRSPAPAFISTRCRCLVSNAAASPPVRSKPWRCNASVPAGRACSPLHAGPG